jgi:hypothetical protein
MPGFGCNDGLWDGRWIDKIPGLARFCLRHVPIGLIMRKNPGIFKRLLFDAKLL